MLNRHLATANAPPQKQHADHLEHTIVYWTPQRDSHRLKQDENRAEIMASSSSTAVPAQHGFVEVNDHKVYRYVWPATKNLAPDGRPRAVLHIQHGNTEFAGRYAGFAAFLNENGVKVYAHDSLAHGKTCVEGEKRKLGMTKFPWIMLAQDCKAVCEREFAENSGVPFYLLGHSVGTLVAQKAVAMGLGAKLAGLVLSAPVARQPAPNVLFFRGLMKLLGAVKGRDYQSELMENALVFDDYRKPFPRTAGAKNFNWLTRDEEVVKAYERAGCGHCLSVSYWDGYLAANREIGSDDFGSMKGKPVLVMVGEKDPVAAASIVPGPQHQSVYRVLQEMESSDVKVLMYGEGRHEILNELNRGEVWEDVFHWLRSERKFWRTPANVSKL